MEAADAAPAPSPANPCCAELKKKNAKLLESRNVLRAALKIYEEQLSKLQSENNTIKNDCDEERKRAELEKEAKLKETRIRLGLEKELMDLKADISSYQQTAGSKCSSDDIKLLEARIIEVETERNMLRELLEKEKQRCDSEKKKAKAEKGKAAEAKKLLAIEKSKVEDDRRLVEAERKNFEVHRHALEKLKSEAKEVREKLIVEKSKADNAIKKVELEKQKTQQEKLRADSEMMKAQEQMKLLDLERKKAVDEKLHLDYLSQQLEEEKQKTQKEKKRADSEWMKAQGLMKLLDLERKKAVDEKLHLDCLSRQLEEEKQMFVELNKKIEVIESASQLEKVRIKLLNEKLKLEKKRVNCAKRMAREEKLETQFISQQVNIIKEEFIQLSNRLNMLTGSLALGSEGKEGMTKESSELPGFNLRNKVFGIEQGDFSSRSYLGSKKVFCNVASNYSDSTKEFTSCHLSGGGCTRPISGINSELESPNRDSIRKKSQSSAVCSTTTHVSDRTFMGSQGNKDLLTTRCTKFAGCSSKSRPSVPKRAGEACKIRHNVTNGVTPENIDRSSIERNAGNGGMETEERLPSCRKKRRIDETLESIELLFSEDNQLRLKLDETLSVLRDTLSDKDGPLAAISPCTCGISGGMETRRGLLSQEIDYVGKPNCKHDWCSEERQQKLVWQQPSSQSNNQQQASIHECVGIGKTCSLPETTAGQIRMQENTDVQMEDSVTERGVLAEYVVCTRNYKHAESSEEQRQHILDCRPINQSKDQQQAIVNESEGIGKQWSLSVNTARQIRMQEDTDGQIEESVGAFSSDQSPLISSGNISCEDYLKLLDLDNVDDERRFRAAMEAPLSPTLPEISPRSQLYEENDSHHLVDRHLRKSESGKDDSISFCAAEANRVNHEASKSRELSYDSRNFTHVSEEPKSSVLSTSHCEIVHTIEHNPCLTNRRFVDVEQLHDATESNDSFTTTTLSIKKRKTPDWQAKPVECFFDSKTISVENVSGIINSNGNSVRSDEDMCARSRNAETHDLPRNTRLVVNGPEKSIGVDQMLESNLIRHQMEVESNEPDISAVRECGSYRLHATELMVSGKNLKATGQPSGTSIRLVLDSSTKTESVRQMPISTIRKPEHPSIGSDVNVRTPNYCLETVGQIPLTATRESEYPCKRNSAIKRTPKYCITFLNTKEESMSKIVHTRDALLCQNFIDGADCEVAKLLPSLELKLNLLPEEKASIFFSLLMYSISGTSSLNSKSVTAGDILQLSESFAAKINRVVAVGKASWLYKEVVWLDMLLNLIEDFLIRRKVVMYNDIQSGSLYPDVSACVFNNSKEGNILFSYKDATVDQLVAASTLLACICAATNQIGLLLETSYKILLRSGENSLLVLHAFAYVVGDKFLNINNYSFLLATIRSVVSLLERGHGSRLSSSLNSHPPSDVCPRFLPCDQCPFHLNAISEDKCITLLLDMLQDFSCGVRCISSAYTIQASVERDKGSTHRDYGFGGVHISCGSSCILLKHIKSTDLPDFPPECTFCPYTDIVSLVELVGCYVSWEWTSTNIIPRLLVILESSISDEFSAALFVLIGQLASSGIDAHGYQQSGVIELRRNLSTCLDAFIAGKGSIPTQFAAVGALLNLLPLSFGQIVDGYVEQSASSDQSHHVSLIKHWFSQLSAELQSLSLSFFGSMDTPKF